MIATETSPGKGIYNGETLGFLCLECKNMDEDVGEIIHENDCSLAGATEPTAYEDRLSGPLFDEATQSLRADGGE